ncbi:hypothetical protein KIMH_04710 [Bombiscardovia apis]|uniref:DUF1266 domain-containing protein n=1 Tax=Bombiscardovia apis TaxID=2932182 RepID=A0ABM8BBV1_9BIFI|nr:DUF1266 domain-containing protein [Bombiscardovia apis]BDR54360.1 hypothetical protein KIMH_04710 [Bombiscardovia apis]
MSSTFKDKLKNSLMPNGWLHAAPNSSALNPHEQWIVALGSFTWSYLGDYVNAFESEDDASTCAAALEQWWGVSDTDSYRQRAQGLISQGQRSEFQPLVDLISDFRSVASNISGIRKLKVGFFPTSIVSYYYKQSNTSFKASMKDLGMGSQELTEMLMMCSGYGEGDDFGEFLEDFAQVKSALAWDAVRVVHMSSLAYSAGYVSRGEAMQYSSQLKSQVEETYTDWRNAAAGYVLGAWLWDRTDTRLDNISRTTSMLLKDPESLVNQVAFK